MAHSHILVDDDNRFIIDGATRQITNLTGNRPSVQQYDHNSEKLVFQIPRYIEGHDMLECDRVEFNYTNTGKGTSASTRPVVMDKDEITDLAVSEEDPEILTFSWTIPQGATPYAGTIVFQVVFICSGETPEDPPLFKWHTGQYSFVEVLPSLTVDEFIISQYPSLLERLMASVDQIADERATDVDLSALDTEGIIVETCADGSIRTTTMEFDADGNPVKITDSYGNVTILKW